MLQEFRKHWDRIDIICPRVPHPSKNNGSGALVEESSPIGGSVFFHSCPLHLFYQPLWIMKKGRALVREHGHDVMTVHEYPPFYNGVGAGLIARKLQIPYALEVHHLVGFPQPADWKERIGRFMSRRYLRLDARGAQAVRVVNAWTKEKLITWGVPEKKIHIVPSFYLDADLLRQKLKPPVSYDVSFCGRLVANKNLRSVIRAVHQLPGARLLVIGDGPERSACEELVQQLGMENRVTFVGWLPTIQAVIGAITTARVFVMSSHSEGGPRNALEAMAAGMPVIATRVGIMPEVIQDGLNGIFTTGDPDDLAKKIKQLLGDDALCKRLGAEATKILDRFERTRLIGEYADFLQGLARSSSS
ncbi:MAG: glycosyltransferase [Candidatus Absconditabacterales bacterium]